MRPSEEALAFSDRLDKEGHGWPQELRDAATFLLCEIKCVPYKSWKETGGPARLAEYTEKFARLYAAWRSGLNV